ncbi:MAG TPA: hypothetical protein VEJ84_17090, partial [Acidimicrobiales bacterium]|nr:hypothetical protein [Acidimicrobiales bacterium]
MSGVMEVAVEGFRLNWARRPEGADLSVSSEQGGDQSTAFVFRFISDPPRCRLKLALVVRGAGRLRGAGRTIDVSAQPGLVRRV